MPETSPNIPAESPDNPFANMSLEELLNYDFDADDAVPLLPYQPVEDPNALPLDDVGETTYDVYFEEEMLREQITGLSDIYKRPINQQEFLGLLAQYPFVEICQFPLDETEETGKPNVRLSDTDWLIYDYGNRLIAGPGRLRLGGFHMEDSSTALSPWDVKQSFIQAQADVADDEEGEDGGSGTLHMQGILTAQQLAMMGITRWNAIELVDGNPHLIRAAWMVGYEQDAVVAGFLPTDNDKRKYYAMREKATEQEKVAAKVPEHMKHFRGMKR